MFDPALSKILRNVLLLIAYAGGLAGSLWLAFQLRFDFNVAPEYFAKAHVIFLGMVGTKLLLLLLLGQFGSLLTYFGFHDLGKILVVCAVSAGLALLARFTVGLPYAPPRAVVVTDLLISFLYLCGFRLCLRLFREGYFQRSNGNTGFKRVGVIGAGDVGATLVRDFQVRRGLGSIPKVFFDDDSTKWGTRIHGVGVAGAPEQLPEFLRRQELDEIVIAMPSASGRRVREIITLLNQLHLRFEIVPSYQQLVTGKVRVSQVRQVELQDLLGRAPVDLQTDRIRELVQTRVVMVTGAGGSIGSELSRQIAAYGPRLLLLVERSEFLLFQTEQELRQFGYGSEIVPLVADITDERRMRGIFRRFAPAVLFHAAAHKHVPMMEAQPTEAFRNNTLGTRRLAELAVEHAVDRFVLISTDKAINPTNVMGATKRMAELYVQSMQRYGQTKTKFMAVRFGNVLGSSGSVIPTFKRQIAAGGPVTVTHPDVTRYFMTVNEAVGLVLQSATQGLGGEIFVLNMGEPMKIVDVARQLIELSGLEPGTDIEIQFTGLRPGEKLYEELNHNTENVVPTTHPQVRRFVSEPRDLDSLQAEFAALVTTSDSLDPLSFKQAIKRLVPEYQPYVGLD